MSDNHQEKKPAENKFNVLLNLSTKPQITGQLTTFKYQSRDVWLSHPGTCYAKYNCWLGVLLNQWKGPPLFPFPAKTHISGWGLEGEPVADTTAAGQWLHKTSLVLRLKWNEMKRNQDKGGWEEQRLRAGRSFLSSGQSKHLVLFLLNTKLKTLLLSCNYLLVRPHKEKLDL